LARARERAEAAEARAQELRILQTLSAELVGLVPGSGAYQPILSQLLGLFGFSAGALYVHDPERGQLQEQVAVGTIPAGLALDPDPSDAADQAEWLVVSVGGRPVGLLLLHGQRPALGPEERRVLGAFCDQFALVLERDRLARQATEAEVYRQSDQVRRSLLAAVSHDLRSPLAAIKASVTDLLGQDVEQDADYAREALESIDVETDRLASLIANLLDMSRIEGGMLRARLQNVDLAEVLSACVDRVCRQWLRLTVPLSIEPAASVVRADPVFLERVAANLLDNAAKAAAESGNEEVAVQARQADGTATVCVIDHGKGVPSADREQLFYPFYQVTERHPRLGTGLGLAICKGFLSLMDGQIWIEDTQTAGPPLCSRSRWAWPHDQQGPRPGGRRRAQYPPGGRPGADRPRLRRAAGDRRGGGPQRGGGVPARPGRARPEPSSPGRPVGLPPAPRLELGADPGVVGAGRRSRQGRRPGLGRR
jgi:two-component system sensor histidine kinase KdpD